MGCDVASVGFHPDSSRIKLDFSTVCPERSARHLPERAGNSEGKTRIYCLVKVAICKLCCTNLSVQLVDCIALDHRCILLVSR